MNLPTHIALPLAMAFIALIFLPAIVTCLKADIDDWSFISGYPQESKPNKADARQTGKAFAVLLATLFVLVESVAFLIIAN